MISLGLLGFFLLKTNLKLIPKSYNFKPLLKDNFSTNLSVCKLIGEMSIDLLFLFFKTWEFNLGIHVLTLKHQHIVEMGLTLLAQAKLPLKFWWDSFVAFVCLINKLPTQLLSHFSPYQKFFDKKPDYSFLKVFGCACFPYLRPYNSHKLEFRTSKCVFLGYNPSHKGYRCLDSKGRISIARSVEFNEMEFPYESLFLSEKFSQFHESVSPSSFPISNSFPFELFESISLTTFIPSHSDFVPCPDQSSSVPNSNSANESSSSPPVTSCPNESQSQPQSCHPMITHAKSGIFKPKNFTAAKPMCEIHVVTLSISEALIDSRRKQAMMDEFQALMKRIHGS